MNGRPANHLASVLLSLCIFTGTHNSSADLAGQFTHPPEAARPWVFWYWMNGNVTRDGITKDLEAMKEVGIGGAYLFSIGTSNKKQFISPLAESLTPHWWELVTHAITEAKRLDLKIGFNACDGWATASGPWITPEMSMQKVVWAATNIANTGNFDGLLPQPTANLGYYRDIAVLAFPTPPGSGETSLTRRPKVTTNIPGISPERVLDGDSSVETDQEGWIQFAFDTPFTCRSIRILPSGANNQPNRLEIQVSDDGTDFRSLGRLEAPRHGWQDSGTVSTHSIPETTAKYFRFVYDRTGTEPGAEDLDSAKFSTKLKVKLIELSSEPKLNGFEGKSGIKWRWSQPTSTNQIPNALCVSVDQITNLTSQMSANGRLAWQAPSGDWTILRMGYTTTGQESAMGGAGKGLECDKFNPAALQIQFEHWLGEAAKRARAVNASDTLWMSHVDSWESDSQNWSPVFAEEFRNRRGYDPVPYLPAMTGIPVQSAEISERFLLDVRRTIAELVGDNFFRPLVKLSHEHGYKLSAESVAPTMMSDGMLHHGIVDFPMGEFWLRSPTHDKPTDIREAVSAAHVYGKPVIQAEAFTELRIQWDETPYLLKAPGDHSFCEGINRLVFHVYCQQPEDRAPGVTLNGVGTPFGRGQTWWKQGKAWIDYITRCQALLQAGRYVADVCYFTGEDLPSRGLIPEKLNPALPRGYAYDSINRDALLTRASVQDGRLTLPDGMNYRVLVLPPDRRMTPVVAEKIRELVKGGLTVVGPKPEKSPSLEDQPVADEKVRQIADMVWGDCDGKKVFQHQFGLGRVCWGKNLEEVFAQKGLKPDFTSTVGSKADGIEWIHRTQEGEDWYFISNQKQSPQALNASFRVAGRIPEFWHPDTGVMEDAPVWRVEESRTIVPLRLGPAGSVFVVFRRNATNEDVVARVVPTNGEVADSWALPALELRRTSSNALEAWASRDGEWKLQYQSGRERSIKSETAGASQTLSGPWSVTFPSGKSAPERIELATLESLSGHSRDGVQFFSGTATYAKEFDWQSREVSSRSSRVFLDLGHVANLAEVRLNGKSTGVLWKPPFVFEITDKLCDGRNRLEIEVTTTWKNRLIGDAGLPPDKRVTWSYHTDAWFPTGTPLADSGLIGPVNLRSAIKLELQPPEGGR